MIGKTKIVFIAGPYFGDGTKEVIEKNIRAAEKYQVALANRKIGFFCPHNHTEHFEHKANTGEQFYYDLDFAFLTRMADAVLAIPGWESSNGAKKEVAWAKEHNLPVFYPASPDELGEVEQWAKKQGFS